MVVWALDFLTYISVLQVASDEYLLANQAGKFVGAISGFFLHKYVTFAGRQRLDPSVQFLIYLGVFTMNIIASSLMLWLLVDAFGAGHYHAKILVDLVVISTSFLAGKYIVYRKR